ncbi:transcription factor 7-like 1 isoform X2 [Melanotaenia boesemani]|uniref:transcription factor 7-like 1 isoform X2 n=1 Tax=Melanotaenia boesemani TaxID=1250792 RepID=UPI001C05EC70|nr:transcription factor 7-like 1 isoform X2 [Melanotaenia boesemani]
MDGWMDGWKLPNMENCCQASPAPSTLQPAHLTSQVGADRNRKPVQDPRPAATPQSACCSQKRKRDDNSEPPYVKKPPNAFMLFLKEQRTSVVAEFGITGSAAVNTILGRDGGPCPPSSRPGSSRRLMQRGTTMKSTIPKWSSRDNYGQKMKRRRRRSTAPSSSGCNTKPVWTTACDENTLSCDHTESYVTGLDHRLLDCCSERSKSKCRGGEIS